MTIGKRDWKEKKETSKGEKEGKFPPKIAKNASKTTDKVVKKVNRKGVK